MTVALRAELWNVGAHGDEHGEAGSKARHRAGKERRGVAHCREVRAAGGCVEVSAVGANGVSGE